MSDIINGIHAVREALGSGRGQLLIVQASNPRLDMLQEQAKKLGIKVRSAACQELDQRSAGVRHQGVALEVRRYDYATSERLLQDAGPIIALDGVEDPGNLGAIIRSTYALGGAGVVIPNMAQLQSHRAPSGYLQGLCLCCPLFR